MNGPFPMSQIEQATPLAVFADLRGKKIVEPDRARLVAGAVTIAVHVLLLAGLLFGTMHVANVMPVEKVLMAEVVRDASRPREVRPVPPPQLMNAQLPEVPVPTVNIAQPAEQQTIAVAAATQPSVQQAPSSPPGETAVTFQQRLFAHLNRYKRYPRQARAAHIEGVVLLHFIMNRTGQVLAFDIARSSGRPLLDGEARSLIARAQPLPTIPDGWPQQTLDITVPIEFSLR
ncbi:MAG: TonB family protein [Alphaproteobacteria bacterium]|nr:TonB family protein [Alphaproteobacteria bacterium]